MSNEDRNNAGFVHPRRGRGRGGSRGGRGGGGRGGGGRGGKEGNNPYNHGPQDSNESFDGGFRKQRRTSTSSARSNGSNNNNSYASEFSPAKRGAIFRGRQEDSWGSAPPRKGSGQDNNGRSNSGAGRQEDRWGSSPPRKGSGQDNNGKVNSDGGYFSRQADAALDHHEFIRNSRGVGKTSAVAGEGRENHTGKTKNKEVKHEEKGRSGENGDDDGVEKGAKKSKKQKESRKGKNKDVVSEKEGEMISNPTSDVGKSAPEVGDASSATTPASVDAHMSKKRDRGRKKKDLAHKKTDEDAANGAEQVKESGTSENTVSKTGDLLAMNYPIKINVGGRTFEILPSTFCKYENSVLAKVFRGEKVNLSELSINPRGEIFFDRNPYIFECLLSFCRCGSLYIPPNVPVESVKIEAKYFGLIDCMKKSFANEKYVRTSMEDEAFSATKKLKMNQKISNVEFVVHFGKLHVSEVKGTGKLSVDAYTAGGKKEVSDFVVFDSSISNETENLVSAYGAGQKFVFKYIDIDNEATPSEDKGDNAVGDAQDTSINSTEKTSGKENVSGLLITVVNSFRN
eukprot:Nk52_evm2s710 gene=Nk52_evmTU2s710